MLDLIDPLRPRRHRVAVGRQTGGDEAGRMTDGSGGVPHVLADSQGSAVHLPHPFEITYAYETYDIQPPPGHRVKLAFCRRSIQRLDLVAAEPAHALAPSRPWAGSSDLIRIRNTHLTQGEIMPADSLHRVQSPKERLGDSRAPRGSRCVSP
jgi:hypothetical protein